MGASRVAGRYARAIFELAVDNRSQEKIFADLRLLENAVEKEPEIHAFFANPVVSAAERTALVEKALANKGLAKEVYDLVILLAKKNRLGILKEIVDAFEHQSDTANGVCRGVVRSATILGQPDRSRIEQTVEKVLKKKVIMHYQVDPAVIGGLVAQVGSYTFDDSLEAHLRRMNEELKRRST